jgi:hypothetical protein
LALVNHVNELFTEEFHVLIGGLVGTTSQNSKLLLKRPMCGFGGHSGTIHTKSVQQMGSSMGEVFEVGMQVAARIVTFANKILSRLRRFKLLGGTSYK